MKSIRLLAFTVVIGLALAALITACGDDDDAEDVAEDVQEEAEDAADEAEEEAEDAAGDGDNNVAIVDNDFDPTSITVSVGDTVTWTNTGQNPHTVTSDEEGVWDSGTLDAGATFTFTFEEAGTVTYHCEIHPSMQAEVVVE